MGWHPRSSREIAGYLESRTALYESRGGLVRSIPPSRHHLQINSEHSATGKEAGTRFKPAISSEPCPHALPSLRVWFNV